MDITSVLKLFGGLGLFLYGMGIMGGTLERFAGGKLERVLEKATNNPIKGVLLGALVTAIIQSSSATTVMAVGFVNSGLMQLPQTVGIIMGSNIGTTITAWILSLTGIEATNIFLLLLQPKNFSLIFAAVGAVLVVFTKSSKKRNIGTILIGFCILIYGMSFMSDAVVPLRTDPEFQKLLITFQNPIMGVLAGALVTGIIQASAASIGILQALALSGAVTYSAAIPIILGQNIGTCVTAMISAVGAKREAKRVAFVHLYFNLIGTIIFLAIIYLFQTFVGFSFWNDSVTAVDIAIIHTIFNVFCTLMFLPFTKLLAKLATLTVPDKVTEKELEVIPGVSLDPRFLSSPAFAIEQSQRTLTVMCELVSKIIAESRKTVKHYSDETYENIIKDQAELARISELLNSYIQSIYKNPLTTTQSRYLTKLLHSSRRLLRIADNARRMMNIAANIQKEKITFSPEGIAEIRAIMRAMSELTDGALGACSTDDFEIAKRFYPLCDIIHLMCHKFRASHIERIKSGDCNTKAGVYYEELLLAFEQITDRCDALLVQVLTLYDDRFSNPEYVTYLRPEQDPEFSGQFEEFKEKYLQGEID